MPLAWYHVPVSDVIVKTAAKLLKQTYERWGGEHRDRLRAVVNGKVKNVDVRWWRTVNGVGPEQFNRDLEKKHQKRLAKIRAMTDPQANPNKHQRAVAEAKLAEALAAGPPKATHIPSAPGLEEYDRAQAARMPPPLPSSVEEWLRGRVNTTSRAKAAAPVNTTKPAAAATVNTTKPAAKPEPVDTTKSKPDVNTTKPKPDVNTTKKPRTADRHREPNRDRHSPGYMAEYMRRRREAVERERKEHEKKGKR